MSDIFISYARQDRPRAEGLAHALETLGWTVWWDRTIPAGRTFDDVIEEALGAAKCVIVLWSKVSVDSEWVRNEAEDGRARNILVPILVEGEVRIPLAFRRIQAADLVGWDGSITADPFQLLVADITRLVPPTRGEPEGRRQAELDPLRPLEEQERAGLRADARRQTEDEVRRARERPAVARVRGKPGLWVGLAGIGLVILAVTLLPKQHRPALPTAELGASRAVIKEGEAITLTWTTTNTTEGGVRLEPDLGSVQAYGRRVVFPRRNATYRLIATGPGGTVEDTVLVRVLVPSSTPTIELVASDTVIERGQAIALRWATTHVDSQRLEPGFGPIPVAGSRQVTPQEDMTYRLVAKVAGGTLEDTLRVTVRAPSRKDTITGQLTFRAMPIPGIMVALIRGAECDPKLAITRTTSDASGVYGFNGVAPGKYRLAINGWLRTAVPVEPYDKSCTWVLDKEDGSLLTLNWVLHKTDLQVTYPANQSTINQTTPTLRWNAYPGATAYRIFLIRRGESYGAVYSDAPTSTTTFAPERALAPATYEFTVWAWDQTGQIAFGQIFFTVR